MVELHGAGSAGAGADYLAEVALLSPRGHCGRGLLDEGGHRGWL